ncbi:MAG: lipoprotein-releasing ABC transporter permease subunit [Desulfobacteraceae bacterium]|nr:lipoprotein-releasing ABC transporter permease subunit [Desulfobacteraceae bacterium]
MSFELFIATRYLKAKRKEGFVSLVTFLSIVGVAVGVMALVVVIAVMSGAENSFRDKILGLEPHLLVMNYAGQFDNYQKTIEKVQTIKHVDNVSPILFSQIMVRSASSFTGAMLRGIDPESKVKLIKGFSPEKLQTALKAQGLNNQYPGVILGKQLASSLGVAKGSKIILMSPAGIISPMGHIPSMSRFQVTGIFESGMYEYDSALMYINIIEAQKITGMKNGISAIGVWVDDIFSVDILKKKILSILDYKFYARDWMDINKSLFSALKLEKTAMFIILTLIIFVAAFNIASALMMMVMEKTRDIAALKAMGATDKIIRKIFIIKGMIIGTIGTLVGTISGVIICLLLKKYEFIHLPEAYPFRTLPVELNFIDIIVIALSALFICFISTIYPSNKASKMDPVEALRYG